MTEEDRGTCIGQSSDCPMGGCCCFKPYEKLTMVLEAIAVVEGLVLMIIILFAVQSAITGVPIVW